MRVASTEVFEEFEVSRRLNLDTKTKDRGEQAAAEVLGTLLEGADHGAILIFEDSMVRKPNFLLRLPDEVVLTSTSEFLSGLERHGLIADAQAILERAVQWRGLEILKRQLRSATELPPSAIWPATMVPLPARKPKRQIQSR